MRITIIHASEVNYVILTAEQFVTDYPQYLTVAGMAPENSVLVLHDDEEGVVAMIEGNPAMLSELIGDIGDYTKANADPGAVEPKVGPSSTVLEAVGGVPGGASWGDSDPAL